MCIEYRYLGPDGGGIGDLPEGVGAALGSEYCVHLLPPAERMAAVIADAAVKGTPLLLLTPYFRDAEIKRTLPLFRAIPPSAEVDVAVNDWGILQTLHGLFPGMRRSIGRLLSGRKACPRIGVSSRLTKGGRDWHGEGIFSSPLARAFLANEWGVRGYHMDRLPWGKDPPTDSGEGTGEVRWYVHSPHAVVTVSDTCPWIGGVSSARIAACDRPCRNGAIRLSEPSMGGDLHLRGKARFSSFAAAASGDPAGGADVVTVTYRDIP